MCSVVECRVMIVFQSWKEYAETRVRVILSLWDIASIGPKSEARMSDNMSILHLAVITEGFQDFSLAFQTQVYLYVKTARGR